MIHSPGKPSFSEELGRVAALVANRPARLAEVLAATEGRGYELLLVLMSLPFLTPVPLPGFSTPFGLVVALIGARLAVGRKPWLPQRLLARELPPQFMGKLLAGAARIVRVLEYFLKPRLRIFHEAGMFRRISGLLIALSGMFLLLPLPVPFSNALPAVTVLLLAAGAMEGDGLFFLGGLLAFILTASFFFLLGMGGLQAIERFT